jgi:hypothetical protein
LPATRTGAGVPRDDDPERLAGSIHRAKARAASRIRLRLKQFSLKMLLTTLRAFTLTTIFSPPRRTMFRKLSDSPETLARNRC